MSMISDLKKAFKDHDPQFYTERKRSAGAAVGQTVKQELLAVDKKRTKFVAAHLPGDTFVDQDKQRNLERVLDSQKNFSHKAFVTAAGSVEKGHHGGWEGTFAARHGGYPHMFEKTAPEKSGRWLGKITTKPVNTMPMLVPYPSQSGPGFPNRSISGDYRYESEFNYEDVVRLNRAFKLGEGPGFRISGMDGKGAQGRIPWVTTSNMPTEDAADLYKEVLRPERRMGRSMVRAAEVPHGVPFTAAAPERKLPHEGFGSYAYVPEAYIANPMGALDKQLAAKMKKRTGGKTLEHPPFRASGPSVMSITTPSVMFRASTRRR